MIDSRVTPYSGLARSARSVFLVVFACSLTACSTLATKLPWRSSDPVDYALISSNLVDAIGQYPKLNPMLATVQVTPADNALERHVHKEMIERGYKLESANPGQGANGVNAVIRVSDTDENDSAPLYILSVGQLSAERNYVHVDGKTLPASALVIRGGKQRSMTLNDKELFEISDGSLSKVAFLPYEGPAVSDVLKPSPGNKRRAFWSRKNVTPIKQNVYDTMESNYSSLFSDYEDVDQKILVFPNDSLRLGDANKNIIEEYMSLMNPETDVLSVIGCSHGVTDISNGNPLLALGRANRVKEAFLFSGLQHEQVLEEGCWAPTTFDEVMPRRGVVLTLKRRKGT